MTQKGKTPSRWHGEGVNETAWMRQKSNAIRKRNKAADESDIRLDLIQSLRISLSNFARERLLVEVRELTRQGHISKWAARELRALLGGADYA